MYKSKPLVKVGDVIKKGDIIADRSNKIGRTCFGQNVTVAFMPWQGYNFEDSILISERCVTDDVLHRFISKNMSQWPVIQNLVPRKLLEIYQM